MFNKTLPEQHPSVKPSSLTLKSKRSSPFCFLFKHAAIIKACQAHLIWLLSKFYAKLILLPHFVFIGYLVQNNALLFVCCCCRSTTVTRTHRYRSHAAYKELPKTAFGRVQIKFNLHKAYFSERYNMLNAIERLLIKFYINFEKFGPRRFLTDIFFPDSSFHGTIAKCCLFILNILLEK